MKYELVPATGGCPVCKNVRAVRLYQVTTEQAAQHFVRRDLDPGLHEELRKEIATLWAADTCCVLRCADCGFVYAYPYVAGREGFYGKMLHAPSYPQNRFEFDRTCVALEEMCRTDPSFRSGGLLEVGAGDGAFIRRVTPRWFKPADILCTEFSPAGAAAIRGLGGGGVECVMSDVRDLSRPSDQHRFSVVCMFQVLEHLDQLDALWQAINRLTTDGAHLFIAVPSDRWTEFQETRCGQLDMPPNHVGRWCRHAFEIIGKRNGWELAAHAIEPCGRRKLLRTAATSRFFQARSAGGLTDRTTRISNRTLRRLCSIPAFGFWYLRSIPSAISHKPTGMGQSQWAHLRKKTTLPAPPAC